jgi:hypothetical protein
MKIEKVIRSKDMNLFSDYLRRKKKIKVGTLLKKLSNIKDQEAILFIIKIIEEDYEFKDSKNIKKKVKNYDLLLKNSVNLLKIYFDKKEKERNILFVSKYFFKSKKLISEIINYISEQLLPFLNSFNEKKFIDALKFAMTINDSKLQELYTYEMINRMSNFVNNFRSNIFKLIDIKLISVKNFIYMQYENRIMFFINFCNKINKCSADIRNECIEYNFITKKLKDNINKSKNGEYSDSESESFFSEYLFDSEDIPEFDIEEEYDNFDKDIDIKLVYRKKEHVYKENATIQFIKQFTEDVINDVLKKLN